jgi:hypothetical protein
MSAIAPGSSLVGRPEHPDGAAPADAVGGPPSPPAPASVASSERNQSEPFSAGSLPHLVDVGVEAAEHTFSAASLAAQHAWGLIAGEQKKAPAMRMPDLELTGDASPVDRRQLQQGMTGADVTQAQKALTEAGFPVPAIGRFGPKSEAAVLGFQKAHPPLEQTGKVDAETWRALREAAPKSFAATAPAAAARADGRLEYPINHAPDGTPMLVQNDARWGATPLGNSTKGIGGGGCLLTSVSMVLSQKLGRLVDPGELNRVLVKGGAFQARQGDQSGAMMLTDQASKAIEAQYHVALPLAGRVPHAKDTLPTGQAIASAVDTELAAGRQPILHIDTDGDGIDNHFVVVNRKDGHDYVVIDPAMGREYRYRLDEAGQFKARDAYYPHGTPTTSSAPVAHDCVLQGDPPKPRSSNSRGAH